MTNEKYDALPTRELKPTAIGQFENTGMNSNKSVFLRDREGFRELFRIAYRSNCLRVSLDAQRGEPKRSLRDREVIKLAYKSSMLRSSLDTPIRQD